MVNKDFQYDNNKATNHNYNRDGTTIYNSTLNQSISLNIYTTIISNSSLGLGLHFLSLKYKTHFCTALKRYSFSHSSTAIYMKPNELNKNSSSLNCCQQRFWLVLTHCLQIRIHIESAFLQLSIKLTTFVCLFKGTFICWHCRVVIVFVFQLRYDHLAI